MPLTNEDIYNEIRDKCEFRKIYDPRHHPNCRLTNYRHCDVSKCPFIELARSLLRLLKEK